MPRDLESERAALEGMAPLAKGSDANTFVADTQPLYLTPSIAPDAAYRKLKDLHPYSLLLNRDDADECDWLEHLAFESHEAASREKIDYRLNTCGELCTGLFTSAYATTAGKLGELVRSRKFPSVDPADSDRKKILLAHIVATKSPGPLVTDSSMAFPADWRTNYQLAPSTGHSEDGQTICLHSLGVHPDFQHRGLGRILLLGWSQRMRDSGVGKRIALICRERYVGFYEKCGFRKAGPSACSYGGGGWFDMVMDFGGMPKDDDDF